MKTQKKVDVIAFAQKCIALIDTTQMSATYKPATFMALLTVIAQHVDVNGRPPKTVNVADLGREVMRLFWYQDTGIHLTRRPQTQKPGLFEVFS